MDRSDVTLERMRTFVRVAERGSLSAVARDVGAGQSTITRQLRELEEAVGVPLISRNTRHVTLTDEGRRYYASTIKILGMVDEANDEVRGGLEASAGIVRVSCSAFFGVMHVCHMIFAFQDRYPDIRVDLVLTDERVDMLRDGIDLAIHIGPPPETELIRRTLGEFRPVLVAARSYLDERGRPGKPDDLATHEIIRKTDVPKSNQLTLVSPAGELHLATFRGRFRVNHGLAAREALIAGRGIAPVPRWLVDDLVQEGSLEIVLSQYSAPPVPLSMLTVPDRSTVTRVRLLDDFLAERITGVPGVAQQAGVPSPA